MAGLWHELRKLSQRGDTQRRLNFLKGRRRFLTTDGHRWTRMNTHRKRPTTVIENGSSLCGFHSTGGNQRRQTGRREQGDCVGLRNN